MTSTQRQMRLRLEYAATQAALAWHARRVKEAIASRPEVARAFAIAKRARAEWATVAAERGALVAELAQYDDEERHARDRADDCAGRAWEGLSAQLQALPRARLLEAVRDPAQDATAAPRVAALLVVDPAGYLASRLVARCLGYDDPITAAVSAAAREGLGFRGPRTAALTRIAQAGVLPKPARESRGEPERPYVGDRWQGTIPSVKDSAVVFPSEWRTYKDACLDRRTTNRISRIDGNGSVTYETECRRRGDSREWVTPTPIPFAARYASGVAAKRYATIQDRAVIVVRASAKAPPIAVLGVALR